MSASIYRRASDAAVIGAEYQAVLDRWPVAHEERRIPTCMGETFVLSCGSPQAPPLFLFHGAQANSAAWLPDIAEWAAHFQIHAIDMIGEAGFSAPVRPDLAGESHAMWLDDVHAALGVGPVAVVGTSLGGWLALDYARRRPGAVRALALINPAGIGRQKNLLLKAAPFLLFGAWGRRKIREMVFGPRPIDIPPVLQPMHALMDRIGRTIKPRIVSIPRLTNDEIAALDIPVLAIVSGRDALLDARETQARLERYAPDAEICYMSDAYHFLPDQTEKITQFLLSK